jgi:ribose transport system substrate-binding protein
MGFGGGRGVLSGSFRHLPGRSRSAPAISTAAEQQPAKKKIKIGISVPAADHGWTAGIGWWAKRAMTLYPDVDWVYATAQNPEKQTSDIEDMMVKGVDGLVILATESAPITPIAKKAHEKGIFIVNVDRGFLEPVADIFLKATTRPSAASPPSSLREKMKGKGNLVILTGIPCTVDSDRVNAAKEVFAGYPDIKILGPAARDVEPRKGTDGHGELPDQVPQDRCRLGPG